MHTIEHGGARLVLPQIEDQEAANVQKKTRKKKERWLLFFAVPVVYSAARGQSDSLGPKKSKKGNFVSSYQELRSRTW